MGKQLAKIRADREANESGDREAAAFHRETERKRLAEGIKQLKEQDTVRRPDRFWPVTEDKADRLFDAGAGVEEILKAIRPSGPATGPFVMLPANEIPFAQVTFRESPSGNVAKPTDNAPLPEDNGDAGPVVSQDWRAIIAARIEDDDYSFNALGKEARVSPAVVMRFVKGERDIRLATAEKICAALDLVLVPREALSDDY